MSPKTVFYLSLLVIAALMLAAGGFVVRGSRRAVARPRFA